MMTLNAPKNASAKPRCYFSLAMSSLILHTHTSRASFPRSPIFTAFLCTEHDRTTPLTKPPHHTITNTGERMRERTGVRSSDHGLTCYTEENQKDFFSFQTHQVPISFLEATAGILLPILSAQHLYHTLALLSRALQPVNLVLLLSTKFPPIYFPLVSDL